MTRGYRPGATTTLIFQVANSGDLEKLDSHTRRTAQAFLERCDELGSLSEDALSAYGFQVWRTRRRLNEPDEDYRRRIRNCGRR